MNNPMHPRSEEEEEANGGNIDHNNTEFASKKETKLKKNDQKRYFSCSLVLVTASNLPKDVLKKGSRKRLVTFMLTQDNLNKYRLHLPNKFARENGITRPGKIAVFGKDGRKWLVNILQCRNGNMTLGKGLKEFARGNDLKIGEFFTLELIWENETPTLNSFNTTEFTRSYRRKEQGECSKAREKMSVSTEPNNGNNSMKDKDHTEEMRDDSSIPTRTQFVTLRLTPEDVKGGKLDLPSEFMKANNINKVGKLTMLSIEGTKLSGYLLGNDGLVALESGWKSFCEANGVKIGEYFTLEFVYELDRELVFMFWSTSRLKRF